MTQDDLDAEARVRPWAELAVVGLGVVLAVSAPLLAGAFREMFAEVIQLVQEGEATNQELEAAFDAAAARQDDYWWLNLIGFVPLALLAGLAVWTNRVATTARRLGYPARRSTGWAVGGWFVPVVNLWFPYQSIVDSVSRVNPRRSQVLAWWLVYVLGAASSLPVLVFGMFTDASLVLLALLPIAVAIVQVVLGLRVVALVHDDHAAALQRP